jgi:hypothetical protein
LGRLCDQEHRVQIGSKIISPVSAMRDLGGSELSMKQHVSRTTATFFFHLRRAVVSLKFAAALDAT